MLDGRLTRRNMIIGTGVGAAGLVMPASACPRGKAVNESRATLRIGVIADVHQDVMHDGGRRLQAFVDAMRIEKPDCVVQLGDFCVPHERNDAFMKIWNAYDGPRYHVIGNHETDGGYTREQVVEYFGMPGRYYSGDRNGLHVVVLDGNDRGGTSSGYPRFIAEEQLTWLKDDLASTTLPTIILVHQPLDSTDGVDNRADVRATLVEANATPGHANVIAVLAGHSHIDYCRLLDGIYYVMLNSASYQWVGGDHRHPSYPAEVHAASKWIDHTCPYRDPLWAMVSIDLERRVMQIDGRATTWVGPSPVECGADYENEYWGWNPLYSRPEISSWRVPLVGSGDLG